MTERAHLYVNSKGWPVRRHSFSAGSDYNHCNQFYKLKRRDGWTEKKKHAYFEFGKCVEAAVRYYHENNLDLPGAIDAFFKGYLKTEGWQEQRDKNLDYTVAEGDWEALADSGKEMVQLYALKLPTLPFLITPVPRFQIEYSKEVFPDTKLAGIEFVAYIDMIAHQRGTVPELSILGQVPKTPKLLVDIKTAAKTLPRIPGIAAMSKQLKTYSWLTDIAEVAFLRFIKTNRALERSSEVTLLQDAGKWKAGWDVTVIKYQEFEPAKPADPAKPKSKPKPEQPEELWIVANYSVVDEMFAKCGNGQTNSEKDARKAFIQANAVLVDKKIVTKQRIEYVSATITRADQEEMATKIGREIAEIHHADQTDFWPREGDITYPNDKCPKCPMLGLCLNNAELRDELVERKDDELKQINPAPASPESEQMEFAMSEFD